MSRGVSLRSGVSLFGGDSQVIPSRVGRSGGIWFGVDGTVFLWEIGIYVRVTTSGVLFRTVGWCRVACGAITSIGICLAMRGELFG